ncbi:glycosyltransferase family 39 protein [bacterium]|nr:glycosyltransferase family 39 protein [bacterium]
MATNGDPHNNGDQNFFPPGGLLRVLILVMLFAGALAIRLYHIGDPPFDFNPTRQYRSALLARSYYYETNNAVTAEDKAIAQTAKPDILEPPLMEYVTSWLYRIVGTESLIIPRLISILCWLVAAVFLYQLCLHGISSDAALVSTAYFLFVPFGIYASRSFQPDPLMVMVFIWAIWAIFRYREGDSSLLFFAVVALSALATFIKPVCIFPLWLTFLFTSMTEKGVRSTLRDIRVPVFLILSFLPTLLFYGYGILSGGFLKDQASNSFLPHLLIQRSFWNSWLRLALDVAKPGALALSLLAFPLIHSRLTRNLLMAMWGGYFVFGMVFTYHIHTHIYYHLILIPIVAISFGASIVVLLRSRTATSRFWQWMGWGILVFAIIVSVKEAKWHMGSPEWESQVQVFKEIGEHVDHSTKTVFLANDYGKPLLYYGMLSGSDWPPHIDFLVGGISEKEYLDFLLSTESSEYFIVTNFPELEIQQNLKEILENYPILVSNDTYQIYDFRNTEEDDNYTDGQEEKRE